MKFSISITSVAVLVSIAIAFTSPALGEVLCPGQAESDYCDCQTDCSDNPSFCGCAEAQASECCATTPDPETTPSPSYVPVSTSGVSVKKNTASIHFVVLGIVFTVVSAMIV